MMQKMLLVLAAAAFVGVAGCAGMEEKDKTAGAPASGDATVPGKPALSAEAQAALKSAEADVKAAKAKNALWTTAQDALKAAEEAAESGDSATVIKQSRIASEHVKLGLGQLDYPEIKIGD